MPEEKCFPEDSHRLDLAAKGSGADRIPALTIDAKEPRRSESKVVCFCEGLIEAGWLIAVILTPLFFNIYSQQVFEPDKATALRMLASLLLLAWVVKATWSKEAWHREVQRIKRLPLLIPAAAVLASHVVSSFLSVVPISSWLGSYERRAGTLTLLAYLVIFILMATHLRRGSQFRRLLFAVILTSVPVSAYAIAQFFDVDPLPWGNYFRSQAGLRVMSTLGNPIFLGAFLLFPFFGTLGWILVFGIGERTVPTGLRPAARRRLSLVAVAFVLGIQSLALFLTSSRGPLLGLLAGLWFLFTAGVLLARTIALRKGNLRRAKWMLACGVGSLIAGLALPLLLIAGRPVATGEFGRESSRLERLLRLDSPTVRVRTILWEAIPKILESREPLEFPDGGHDALHPLRPWVGYGPEAFGQAFARHYPAELGRYEKRRARPDRAHNDPLQILVTRGWLGLLAYTILLVEILGKSAQWLGLTRNRREAWSFRLILLSAGAVAAVACWLLTPAFLGFALLGGVLAGFLACWCFLARPAPEIGRTRAWFLLICLAALVSHWAETQTSFPITSTGLYFWIICAVMVALGERPVLLKPEGSSSTSGALQQEGMVLGLLACLALVTLCFDFVGNWNRADSALAQVLLWISGEPVSGWLATLPNLLLILLLTWSVGALLLLCRVESSDGFRWSKPIGVLLVYSLFSLGPAYLFLSIQAFYPAGVRIFPDEPNIQAQLTFQHVQVGLFLAVVAAWMIVGSLALTPHRGLGSKGRKSRGLLRRFMVIAFCTSLAFVAVEQGRRTLRADILVKQAQGTAAVDRDDLSQMCLGELLALRTRESYYHSMKGVLELNRAKRSNDLELREALFFSSRTSFEAALQMDPLSVAAYENLAVLWRADAERTSNQRDRSTKLAKARAYLQQALSLSPNLAYLYNELGAIWIAAGDYEKAGHAYERSLQLDDRYPATYLSLGFLERLQAETMIQSGDVEAARAQYRKAVLIYESLLRSNPDIPEAHSALAFLWWQLGQEEQSIRAHEEVLRLEPGDLRSLRRLGEIYLSRDRFQDASRYVRRGLQIAPTDPSLLELDQQLSLIANSGSR